MGFGMRTQPLLYPNLDGEVEEEQRRADEMSDL